MQGRQLEQGRSFGVVFEPGEQFFPTLEAFCAGNGVRQGYIPMFLAAFSDAAIVGTCEKVTDPAAPVWSSVHVDNVEAFGCGTLAWDPDRETVAPHIHTTLGLKQQSATGHTSHLLAATTQFVVEMIVVEIAAPDLRRIPNPDVYDTPLLRFL